MLLESIDSERVNSNMEMIYRPNCCICNCKEKSILFSSDFVNPVIWNFLDSYYCHRIDKDILLDQRYEVAKCKKWGFIWQTYILDEQGMKQLYDEWISKEHSLHKKSKAGIDFYFGYAKDVGTISILLKKNPHQIQVLDYGMGWGYWCMMAQAFGYNVHGMELSINRQQFAKVHGINVISNISDLPEPVDYINCDQVMEHIPDPFVSLKEITRFLMPGGIIKITVPDGKRIEKQITSTHWIPAKNAIHPLEHINCFTHKSLVAFAA